jgi:aspartate aminotransferase
VITPGSKWGVFATMYLLLKGGGNVVVPTPYWTAYGLTAKTLDAETRLLKTEFDAKWRVDLEAFKRLLDGNTRMIILNNPNNPTSNVMDRKSMDGIVQLANERSIPVLSDEVYADISFVKTKSILDYGGNHMMVTGFSKMFTMTGWRIGYVVADKAFIDQIARLNQITFSNVPVFIQEAALKALGMHDELTQGIKSEYQERAKIACEILAKAGLEFTEPDAPFYVFPRRRGLDSERFALDLLDKGVAVAPGTSFGDYREHFRISLTAPRNDIETALNKICEALQ